MELSFLGDLKRTPFVIACYGVVAGLVQYWLSQLTEYVPEPYLDEIFHIPQAQAYCGGDFQTWDQKLTTPPGLYIFSFLILKTLPLGINSCIVQNLRATNLVALFVLQVFAQLCRRHILQDRANEKVSTIGISWDAVHSAINICLFPPIFFFSGLYYTDVLSTAVVLASYNFFLSKRSMLVVLRGLGVYSLGIWALFMRQTNIFWVGVFLAGLEAVRACKQLSSNSGAATTRAQSMSWLQRIITQYAGGIIHDPPMAEAGIIGTSSSPLTPILINIDIFSCLTNTVITALSNPLLVLKHLWPHIALLVSFTGFVAWNGGVVLGDKSNHVATIHLAQMLYIWPFFAFFSLPLLYPYGIGIFKRFISFFQVPRDTITAFIPTFVWLIGFLVLAQAIVHFNTIIHPFTLADNRHYVFYVFRYTIRRHPLVKYALAPIYVACGWLVMMCLGGTTEEAAGQKDPRSPENKTSKIKRSKPSVGTDRRLGVGQNSPSTSFVLIWLASTTLSLMTAPLVEPRYFIIPWVIWRLNIPPLSSIPAKDSKTGKVVQPHDHRLWLETAWFAAINVATAYVFLFRGFEWPQEPGKVQRFMW